MKYQTIASAAALCVSLALPASATELKFGFGLPLQSHMGAGAEAFKAKLEELSGGELTVELLPGFQGGNERAALEAVQIGSLDLAMTAVAPLGNFAPGVEVLDLPYLFRDKAHARKVQDGPVGQMLLDKISQAGFIGLGWGEGGFRQMTNDEKPIKTPEDVKGLKIRTMQSETHMAAFNAMGALATPMSWSEVIPALQTGALDAQENAIPIIVATRVYETQHQVSLTQHAFTNISWVFSPMRWNGFSDAEKGWVREATRAGIEAERARVDEDDVKGIKILEDAGVTITEVDTSAFSDAVQPAYEGYEKTFGKDLIDEIRSIE
jgi:tripartite ATP-independent transporter DctP family solute receptor